METYHIVESFLYVPYTLGLVTNPTVVKTLTLCINTVLKRPWPPTQVEPPTEHKASS
jgi:hypothetical protein